jgi:hypothetical protein
VIAGYGPSGKFKDLTSYKSNKKCLIYLPKTQIVKHIPGVMACWYSPIWGSLKPGKGPGFKSSGVHVKFLPMSLTLGVANGLARLCLLL